MTPTIRPARAEDWPSIRALLEAQSLPIDGAEVHLREFLVATNGASDDVIGVAGLERYADVGLVRSVAVGTDVAAQGLGTALTRAILRRAREEGVRALYLLTTTASRWFPRFGFSVVPRDQLPAVLNESAELRGACPSTAVAMRLPLG
jgi:N-acetylglutamate synthase-like GNAT family acetyltransferase